MRNRFPSITTIGAIREQYTKEDLRALGWSMDELFQSSTRWLQQLVAPVVISAHSWETVAYPHDDLLLQVKIFPDLLRWWSLEQHLPSFDGESGLGMTCPKCLRVLPETPSYGGTQSTHK